MQIRSMAWTRFQLLSLVAEKAFPVDVVAQWLRMEFTGLACRDALNRKSSIRTFPKTELVNEINFTGVNNAYCALFKQENTSRPEIYVPYDGRGTRENIAIDHAQRQDRGTSPCAGFR